MSHTHFFSHTHTKSGTSTSHKWGGLKNRNTQNGIGFLFGSPLTPQKEGTLSVRLKMLPEGYGNSSQGPSISGAVGGCVNPFAPRLFEASLFGVREKAKGRQSILFGDLRHADEGQLQKINMFPFHSPQCPDTNVSPSLPSVGLVTSPNSTVKFVFRVRCATPTPMSFGDSERDAVRKTS